jgi:hypothetical protein
MVYVRKSIRFMRIILESHNALKLNDPREGSIDSFLIVVEEEKPK